MTSSVSLCMSEQGTNVADIVVSAHEAKDRTYRCQSPSSRDQRAKIDPHVCDGRLQQSHHQAGVVPCLDVVVVYDGPRTVVELTFVDGADR